MSKRAEEKAIAYQLATRGPNVMGGASILSEDERKFWDINHDFKAGYERAEEDLALTWEDIKQIVQISYDLDPLHNDEQRLAEFHTEEAFYKEVLKQFEEGRK